MNFQPRVGFAYALPNEKTVIRGGGGKYFAELRDPTNISRVIGQTATITIPNDGRPDFAVNPFNGPPPTFEVLSKSKGQDITTRVVSPDLHSAYSWQASLGVQHQLGQTMAVEADYVHMAQRSIRDTSDARNVNLSYNPSTGERTTRSVMPVSGPIPIGGRRGWIVCDEGRQQPLRPAGAKH